MKIRAAVLREMRLPQPYAQSRPLAIEEIELDPPGPGEVMVRVRAAGLCHSDLSVIDGNRPRPMPIVIGHEASGEVVELGAGVRDLSVGDHVVTHFVPSCGTCDPCAGGRPALCAPALAVNLAGTLLAGTRRLHDGRGAINHHLGVSAFADHVTVARNSLVRVDASLPFDQAAVFGCAVITGVGAVVNTAQLPRDASVAVVGLGGVGLAALLGARYGQARTLVAVDLSEEKLAMARALGATHAFNAANADTIEAIREITQGGVEYAFEMAGSVQALDVAYRVTRRGGTTVTAGLPHAQVQFNVSQSSLVVEERTLKGSYLGSCVPSRDIPRYIEWYQAGVLPVDRLLSEHISLEEINAAFDRLAAARTVRQVVTM